MPELTGYERGTWNSSCDQCGRGFKFRELRKRWDNAWCCSACWEIRQPQDFVRGIRDDQSVPVARPRILPVFTPAMWTNSDGTYAFWFNSNGPAAVWYN